jgi:hypothetical protein
MKHEEILKFGEIQYLKGRLDELNKIYTPNSISTENRITDYRISKYEEKLRNTDETAYFLYMTELKNRTISKEKSKNKIKTLLQDILSEVKDDDLVKRINNQIESYK